MSGLTRLVAEPADAGLRLDQFITSRLPGISRSQVQRLLRDGRVTSEPHPAKPGLVVTEGLRVDVDVPPPMPATPGAEDLPIEILYDDEDLVVINKPAGMVVHPAAGHAHGTLVNALLHHVKGLSGIGGTERPGIVHRLDRGTSGIMVIAKHDTAHRNLSAQFHDRVVRKEYQAVVWGTPERGTRYDNPIGRDPNNRKRMSSRAKGGRSALTDVVSVEVLRGVSFVTLVIGTGRTHQIRVHLAEANHPLVGDELYGGVRKRLPTHLASLAKLTRPFLHAARLSFAHPRDGRTMDFRADLPADLARVLKALRQANKRS
ncbi:MAG: RluA family pseudouridine synthase [Acidimicrobiia bacterium]|nr:RluA family pseudouridine synthase [Acidimicrobiia bacterium]